MTSSSSVALVRAALLPGVALCVALVGAPARADKISNPTAVFAGLDKITGRITTFDVAIDETVQFGTLQITPRVCFTRPQTETPLTEGFVEVDDVDIAKNVKRIFSGWMFAASPGLHGVEHPVYDVWLKDCAGGKQATPSPVAGAPDASQPPPANAQAAPPPGTPAKKTRRTIKAQEPVEPTVDSLPPTDSSPVEPPPAAAPVDRGFAAPTPIAPGAAAPGLGAPIEVGSGPAGAASGDSVAPPPKPKKPKKPKPPVDPNAAPIPPADIPNPAPAPAHPQNSGPQDLLKKIPFLQ